MSKEKPRQLSNGYAMLAAVIGGFLASGGIFVGGIVGGSIQQMLGGNAVFIASLGLCILWLVVASTMKQPSYLTTRLIRIAEGRSFDPVTLAAGLRRLPGVAEAVVVSEERLVYLKVDSKTYDAAAAQSAVAAA